MALIDWDTAFDSVHHCKLFDSYTKLGISTRFVQIVNALYLAPSFFIPNEYGTSKLKTHKTGIRKGCPLSFFLLI